VPADLARSFRFRRKIRHEDWDFLLRLARDGVRFLYWHQPLARYWDAADPKRNTRRYSFEPTLYWLEVARDLIAPDAAVAYYFREIYWIHRTRSPAAAALLGLRLACRSPRAAAWLARKVLAAGRERLFPGLQARRP
jgi:hypothetical protein